MGESEERRKCNTLQVCNITLLYGFTLKDVCTKYYKDAWLPVGRCESAGHVSLR